MCDVFRWTKVESRSWISFARLQHVRDVKDVLSKLVRSVSDVFPSEFDARERIQTFKDEVCVKLAAHVSITRQLL